MRNGERTPANETNRPRGHRGERGKEKRSKRRAHRPNHTNGKMHTTNGDLNSGHPSSLHLVAIPERCCRCCSSLPRCKLCALRSVCVCARGFCLRRTMYSYLVLAFLRIKILCCDMHKQRADTHTGHVGARRRARAPRFQWCVVHMRSVCMADAVRQPNSAKPIGSVGKSIDSTSAASDAHSTFIAKAVSELAEETRH